MTDEANSGAAPGPDGTKIDRLLIRLAALVVVIGGLKAATPIVAPVITAAFLAIVLLPVMRWLEDRRIPNSLGVGLITIGGGVTTALLGAVLTQSVQAFSQKLPYYSKQLGTIVQQFQATASKFGLPLDIHGVADVADPAAVFGYTAQLFNGISGILTSSVLILLILLFILLEMTDVPKRLVLALEDPTQTLSVWRKIFASVNGYVLIKTLTSLITGIVVGVTLWLMGIDFPLLWGLLTFFLNFVPNIGSIIAAVPPVLLALIQFGLTSAGWVAVVFLAVNNVVGNGLEPMLMGKRLGMSTTIVFLSLIFWGWVLGPIGMFLSIPLTMIIKVGLEQDPNTKWISILMDQ